MTADVTPIRDRMLFEFRTPTLYTAQWDGTKGQAHLLIGELHTVLEEIGASIIAANYRAQLSRGTPDLLLTIGRHDDEQEFRLDLSREHWLVLWRDHDRLADVETLLPGVGERRFRPVMPVVLLDPPRVLE